jgi:hypothetical protein
MNKPVVLVVDDEPAVRQLPDRREHARHSGEGYIRAVRPHYA